MMRKKRLLSITVIVFLMIIFSFVVFGTSFSNFVPSDGSTIYQKNTTVDIGFILNWTETNNVESCCVKEGKFVLKGISSTSGGQIFDVVQKNKSAIGGSGEGGWYVLYEESIYNNNVTIADDNFDLSDRNNKYHLEETVDMDKSKPIDMLKDGDKILVGFTNESYGGVGESPWIYETCRDCDKSNPTTLTYLGGGFLGSLTTDEEFYYRMRKYSGVAPGNNHFEVERYNKSWVIQDSTNISATTDPLYNFTDFVFVNLTESGDEKNFYALTTPVDGYQYIIQLNSTYHEVYKKKVDNSYEWNKMAVNDDGYVRLFGGSDNTNTITYQDRTEIGETISNYGCNKSTLNTDGTSTNYITSTFDNFGSNSWLVSCNDTSGNDYNSVTNTLTINFDISFNLVSPEDGASYSPGEINFTYFIGNYTNYTSDLDNVTLMFDDGTGYSILATNQTTVAEDSENTFSESISSGGDWYIEANFKDGYTQTSATRSLSVVEQISIESPYEGKDTLIYVAQGQQRNFDIEVVEQTASQSAYYQIRRNDVVVDEGYLQGNNSQSKELEGKFFFYLNYTDSGTEVFDINVTNSDGYSDSMQIDYTIFEDYHLDVKQIKPAHDSTVFGFEQNFTYYTNYTGGNGNIDSCSLYKSEFYANDLFDNAKEDVLDNIGGVSGTNLVDIFDNETKKFILTEEFEIIEFDTYDGFFDEQEVIQTSLTGDDSVEAKFLSYADGYGFVVGYNNYSSGQTGLAIFDSTWNITMLQSQFYEGTMTGGTFADGTSYALNFSSTTQPSIRASTPGGDATTYFIDNPKNYYGQYQDLFYDEVTEHFYILTAESSAILEFNKTFSFTGEVTTIEQFARYPRGIWMYNDSVSMVGNGDIYYDIERNRDNLLETDNTITNFQEQNFSHTFSTQGEKGWYVLCKNDTGDLITYGTDFLEFESNEYRPLQRMRSTIVSDGTLNELTNFSAINYDNNVTIQIDEETSFDIFSVYEKDGIDGTPKPTYDLYIDGTFINSTEATEGNFGNWVSWFTFNTSERDEGLYNVTYIVYNEYDTDVNTWYINHTEDEKVVEEEDSVNVGSGVDETYVHQKKVLMKIENLPEKVKTTDIIPIRVELYKENESIDSDGIYFYIYKDDDVRKVLKQVEKKSKGKYVVNVTGSGLEEGNHTFEIKANAGGEVVSHSEDFYVVDVFELKDLRSREMRSKVFMGIIAFFGVFLTFALIMAFVQKKR